jgi:tRNA nucleotidyltransferase (CCA-adding enzyme)
LAAAIPELAPTIGFSQHSTHHAYDVYGHTAHVTAGVSPDLTLRWAGLLHDIGKVPSYTFGEDGQGHFYGHAQESARLADTIARELKFSTALREEVLALIDQHMTDSLPDEKLLRRRISRLGADTFQSLLQLQAADQRSKGVPGAETVDFTVIHAMVQKIVEEDSCLGLQDLAINGRNLLAMGYAPGKALGACLEYLLEQVLSDALPNEPTALCAAAQIYLEHYPEEHR